MNHLKNNSTCHQLLYSSANYNVKQLGKELAALNREIQQALKPVDKHESGEDKKNISEWTEA